MRLRYTADVRTLVWALGLMPALVIAQYTWPGLAGWLLPLSMYATYSAAVIAHNHNHCPTFASKNVNDVFSIWISIFYGFPTYGWIPTHNENHHRYVGRPGDATVLVDPVGQDGAWLAVTHFFRSSRTQGPLLSRYRQRLRKRATAAWARVWLQYAAVYGAHFAALAVAVALHRAGRGLLVYCSALGLPALAALWGVMFTNWVQHVGCDPYSRYDHSRNFVSGWMNWLVFDNGFHTVHHQRPGLHWSCLRSEHAKIEHLIERRCAAESIFGYAWQTYVAAPLGRRLSSRRSGDPAPSPPYDREESTGSWVVAADAAGPGI